MSTYILWYTATCRSVASVKFFLVLTKWPRTKVAVCGFIPKPIIILFILWIFLENFYITWAMLNNSILWLQKCYYDLSLHYVLICHLGCISLLNFDHENVVYQGGLCLSGYYWVLFSFVKPSVPMHHGISQYSKHQLAKAYKKLTKEKHL